MDNRKELTVNNQNLIRLFLITAYILMHTPLLMRILFRKEAIDY